MPFKSSFSCLTLKTKEKFSSINYSKYYYFKNFQSADFFPFEWNGLKCLFYGTTFKMITVVPIITVVPFIL